MHAVVTTRRRQLSVRDGFERTFAYSRTLALEVKLNGVE